MQRFIDAFDAFLDGLEAITWSALALAIVCHLMRVVVRTRGWRNILAAAYPDSHVRWRSAYGAYAAGLGVNAVLPARGGDLLRLYLVKRRIEGATYPTLGATVLVEAIFDAAVASVLLAWALWAGVLPGLDVIPTLPAIDWLWIFRYPRAAAVALVVALVAGFAAGLWGARHLAEFRNRVARGFAVLQEPRVYLRRVVPWQTLDWCFRLLAAALFLEAFGIATGVRNVMLVQVTHALSTVLPLTPGGIGTEQALLVYVLRGEASSSALLGFSVGMKITLSVVNVAIGFLAIAAMLGTLRWRRAVDVDRAASDSR